MFAAKNIEMFKQFLDFWIGMYKNSGNGNEKKIMCEGNRVEKSRA